MEQEVISEKQLLYECIYVLFNDPLLGYVFEPQVAEKNYRGEFTCEAFRAYYNTLQNYDLPLTVIDEQLMILAEEITHAAIEQKFIRSDSRKRGHPKNIGQLMEVKELRQTVHQYINKRLNKFLQLVHEYNELNDKKINLFFRHKKSDWFTRYPIHIAEKPLDATFYFNRNHENITYTLSAENEGKKVKLINAEYHGLVNEPGWVLINNTLYKLQGNITANNLKPFVVKDSISIPRSMEKEYFSKFIMKTAKNSRVVAEGFAIHESDASLRPVLKPEYHIFQKQYGFILKFSYGDEVFSSDDPRKNNISIQFDKDGEIMLVKTQRNKIAEDQSAVFLRDLNLKHQYGTAWFFAEDAFEWLSKYKKVLVEADFGILSFELNGKELLLETPKVEFNLEEKGNDWFGINARVTIGDFEFPFISFRENILEEKREFELPDGRMVLLPKEWFARFKEIFQLAEETEDKTLRISRSRVDLITNKEIPEIDFPVIDQRLAQLQVPESLEATLRPYQLEGFRWLEHLRQKKLGGCLADEMGLGKTLQTLTFLLHIKEQGLHLEEDNQHLLETRGNDPQPDLFSMIQQDLQQVKRLKALVVMPLSLIHNWMNEASKFTPSLKTYSHTGTHRVERPDIFYLFDVVFTTYNTLRNDPEIFSTFQFNYLILDESQYIKNPKSKIYKAVISVKAKHRLVLTGTPVENSLSDLWAQLNFVNPGMLGSFNFFKNEYIQAVEKDNDPGKRKKLKEVVGPYIMRRTIQQVASDLPDLAEQVFFTEMEAAQKKLYEEERSKARNLILDNLKKHGSGKSQMLILKSLMKLRQIANHPLLLNQNNEDQIVQAEKVINPLTLQQSGKFNDVTNQVEQIVSEGHKLLVFSQFVSHLELFHHWLLQEKTGHCMLNGSMDQFTRKRNIDRFNENDDVKVFLVSLKAGGTGLNLTAASYVIILDPWWNPAVEQQAISRAYRIGQKKNVMAYKFIAKDTVEEKILRLQHRKQELANDFLPASNMSKFTDEEIGFLLE